jgi:hypothetical protein
VFVCLFVSILVVLDSVPLPAGRGGLVQPLLWSPRPGRKDSQARGLASGHRGARGKADLWHAISILVVQESTPLPAEGNGTARRLRAGTSEHSACCRRRASTPWYGEFVLLFHHKVARKAKRNFPANSGPFPFSLRRAAPRIPARRRQGERQHMLSPRPGTPGRGVGGEGCFRRSKADPLTPNPSPEYSGEGRRVPAPRLNTVC